MPSIFTRIIQGEIPCHRIYEDALTIAFLDINPLSVGHVLVVPKEEREFLHQLSAQTAAALGLTLQRVSAALVAECGCAAYNILQNNGQLAHQAVPHVHFHIIPKYESSGLELVWRAGSVDHALAAGLAQCISKRLART